MQPQTIKINTSGLSYSDAAAKVWHALFDIYRRSGGELSRMDALIIDLGYVIDIFYNKLYRNYIFAASRSNTIFTVADNPPENYANRMDMFYWVNVIDRDLTIIDPICLENKNLFPDEKNT